MRYEFGSRTRNVNRSLALLALTLCGIASCSGESPELERWEIPGGLLPELSAAYFDGMKMAEDEIEPGPVAFNSGEVGPEGIYRLLGHAHHARMRERSSQLTLRLITEFPEWALGAVESLPPGYGSEEKRARKEAAQLWEQHLVKDPENLVLIRNAARHQFYDHNSNAQRLLEKGESLAPDDPYWPFQLGRLLTRIDDPTFPGGEEQLAEGLAAFERTLDRIAALGLRPPERVWLGVSKASFKAGDLPRAKSAARNALVSIKLLATESPHRRLDDSTHTAHTLLGLVALRHGRTEAGERHLLMSARVEGSPVLCSFGPKMCLADELLAENRRGAVLEYFKLCSEFWDSPKVDRWIEELRTGGVPHLGANPLARL